MKWEYKKIIITIESDGRFHFLVNEKEYITNSLEGAKCQINELLEPKFKDGDILTNYRGSICLYKGQMYYNKKLADFYCGYRITDNAFVFKESYDEHFGDIDEYRLATEEEKQKLFDSIKANGYKWNAETKTLEKLLKFKVGDRIRHKYAKSRIERNIISYGKSGYWTSINGWIAYDNQDNYELVPYKFDINTLKPFDKVLVRLTKDGVWNATFFSHYDKKVKWGCYRFVTTSSKSYSMCIPYKDNEHLLGTSNDCDDYYKTWK